MRAKARFFRAPTDAAICPRRAQGCPSPAWDTQVAVCKILIVIFSFKIICFQKKFLTLLSFQLWYVVSYNVWRNYAYICCISQEIISGKDAKAAKMYSDGTNSMHHYFENQLWRTTLLLEPMRQTSLISGREKQTNTRYEHQDAGRNKIDRGPFHLVRKFHRDKRYEQ